MCYKKEILNPRFKGDLGIHLTKNIINSIGIYPVYTLKRLSVARIFRYSEYSDSSSLLSQMNLWESKTRTEDPVCIPEIANIIPYHQVDKHCCESALKCGSTSSMADFQTWYIALCLWWTEVNLDWYLTRITMYNHYFQILKYSFIQYCSNKRSRMCMNSLSATLNVEFYCYFRIPNLLTDSFLLYLYATNRFCCISK